MTNIPTFIQLPKIKNPFEVEVFQRGKIDTLPKTKVNVIVPSGKMNFDLYRAFAQACKSIPQSIYRENIEITIKHKPRPIRVDALLFINQDIYLIDTILNKSDLSKCKRKCNSIISLYNKIDYIILIVNTNIKLDNVNHKFTRPVFIVEIRK